MLFVGPDRSEYLSAGQNPLEAAEHSWFHSAVAATSVYPVPGLFVAAPECVSARPAAAGYWPGSFLSSAPVVPLSAAWHLPVRRTPSQAVRLSEAAAAVVAAAVAAESSCQELHSGLSSESS